jgi:hypothetical protein
MNALLNRPELTLLLALGIGLLVGVERERSKGAGPNRGAAGLRTFALIGLVGGACGLFGQPLLTAVAGLFVAAAAVASYRRSRPDDPGLTTEVAMFATYLPAGTYQYTFEARAAFPGEYRVLPAHGEMMYFPDVWGRSGGQGMVVTR